MHHAKGIGGIAQCPSPPLKYVTGHPTFVAKRELETPFSTQRGSGSPGQGGGSANLLKFGAEVRNCIHRALMSDRCQSNGNDHLSNFNTLETTCLHVS